ncbi:hypothetical protein [Kitasatospora sp. NPDC085879]|uniref:hypothetical protein n=1 Tax=Kitasatospora sp. NPDC085879 TaxID=3154769 RepID=UPI00341F4CFE
MSADDDVRPFLSGQRRNVLGGLAAAYARGVNSAVFARIGAGLDPEQVKVDGKGGALDGVPAALPGSHQPHILKPFEKDDKDDKEEKDGKETKDAKEEKEEKEGKESKDLKEEKEGKESKDKEDKEDKESKEAKEEKEEKEQKEGKETKEVKEEKELVIESGVEADKVGGVDFDGPFIRFGEPAELPVTSFDAIARAHPDRVRLAVTRGSLF